MTGAPAEARVPEHQPSVPSILVTILFYFDHSLSDVYLPCKTASPLKAVTTSLLARPYFLSTQLAA